MSLDRLLGTWNVTMQHAELPEPVFGRQRYERVLDGAFVMLHASYDHPDVPDALALLTESAYHYFDIRGVTRVFDLEVRATGWTTLRRDDDFWQRSRTTFRGPDAMDGEGHNSDDGGATWRHDFAMTYTRA